MKWPTPAVAAQAAHALVTALVLVLLLVGEPECAAALQRLGVVGV